MNEQSKVYANSANTVFFDQNFNLITQIHDAGEWNAHDMNQYRKGDFLGVTTGKTASINGYNLLEIVFTHDHQYKVYVPFPVSKWRPLTVWIYVRQDQVTVEAPPTEEEKDAIKEANKKATNKQLIDSINAGSPALAASKDQTSGSSSIIGYVVMGTLFIGVVIWAFVSRKKGKNLETAPIVILPDNKRKPQVIKSINPTPPPTVTPNG